MEQIAWIIGPVQIYWSAVIRMLAAAAAICIFLSLWVEKKGSFAAAMVFVPLAAAASLVFSRLAFVSFCPEGFIFSDSAAAFLTSDGFALMGAFAGCILSALLFRLVRLTDDLPELLDWLSLAGSAGIALGRLASRFNDSCRGMILPKDYGLPWVSAVINPVTGAAEYRLATYCLQSMAAGGIFLLLLAGYRIRKKRNSGKSGDTALLFLLTYGTSQVLLDSTRYDALRFRGNGFIHVVQVLGAVAAAVAAIAFGARLVRARGWKKRYLLLWLSQLVCLVLAGYMEYYVQRHGNEALFAYGVMGVALTGFVVMALAARSLADSAEKQEYRNRF